MAQSRGMKTYLVVLFALLITSGVFLYILIRNSDGSLPLTHRFVRDGLESPFEGIDITKLDNKDETELTIDEPEDETESITEVADQPESSEVVIDEPDSDQQEMSDEVKEMTLDIIATEDLTPIERYIIAEHQVQSGECFSLITADYWGDMYLWPDLYLKNDMRTDDPDLIYPGEMIDIYNRLGSGGSFSDRELTEILNSYINVYKIYKGLGEHKNNSAWGVLWAACKYDKDFLDNYSSHIDPADKLMAEKFISEAGYLQ